MKKHELREILRELWESEQLPFSAATLAMVTRVQREREDSHRWAVFHAKANGGPHPFEVHSYRVIHTAVWELEQRAKEQKPERRIQPIPMRPR